jgi:hypothetical protein
MFTFLEQRKLVKMQRVKDPSHSNVHNLKNIRREASRYFRKKEGILEG